MITNQNSEIIRQLYAQVSAKKRHTGNYYIRSAGFTQYTSTARPSGLKTFNIFFAAVGSAFPDYDLSIDNMIVKGDRVMVRYTISGTHKRDFMGMAPTNARINVTGIDIFRLDNGKVVEYWDAAHQMSALPHTDRGALLSSGSRHTRNLTTTAAGK